MELTPLERDVLIWIADHTDEESLRRQCIDAKLHHREFTGVGCFTTLEVDPNSPKATGRVYSEILPTIESPELQHGAGTVLFCEDGLINTLEFFTYGETFPEELHSWRLVPGPKCGQSRKSAEEAS